ncbi:hypothetical protein M0R04_07030 [Candidatus Dojkabacteria bacterium]|jgi:hypothetical protein|nr:hypothetical protein [Candidatus Dojkabacteria bacterium]
MLLKDLQEALKISQYRPLVKNWDKKRYEEIFKKYPHDRKAYRIFLPLTASLSDAEADPRISNYLTELGYTISNYKNGLAKKQTTKQTIRIGKLLAKRPDLLKLFTNDKARAGSTTSDYYVVISRHPYDIGGMSTDRGWTSCMNLNKGKNKRYVPMDVKEGTLIAYLITKADKNIQHPVGRILIKPFVDVTNPKNVILGVCNNVYGANVDGFVDSVVEWVDEINNQGEMEGVFEPNRKLYKDKGDDYKVLLGNDQDRLMWDSIIKDPNTIQYIKNPKETLQIAAVRGDGNAIRHIKNPTKSTQIEAVRNNPAAIIHIKHQFEETQLATVAQAPIFIGYMTNPSETVQLAAVSLDGSVIDDIYKLNITPSKAVQLAAVNQDGYSLRYIKNPSKDVQLAAKEQLNHPHKKTPPTRHPRDVDSSGYVE